MTAIIHPLAGADASVISYWLKHAKGLSSSGEKRLRSMQRTAKARVIFRSLETMSMNRGISRFPDMPDPIFILGHWRSGTTHLYNIMAKAPHFGYVSPLAAGMPGDLLFLGRFVRPFLKWTLPSSRLIDEVKVTPDSPQEDEFGLACLQPLSFLNALYFPKNFQALFDKGIYFDGASDSEIEQWRKCFSHYVNKLYIHQGGKRMVLKNPAHTARVSEILKLWPNAKFIHIVREPLKVFRSTRHYYDKLLPALALEDYGHLDLDTFIIDAYSRMMNKYLKDVENIKNNQLVEMRFEELEVNPMQQLKKIYQQLELNGFGEAKAKFETYLKSVSNYKKNKFSNNTESNERVSTEWKPFIERWGY